MQSRFNLVTVGCFVLAVYLVHFMISQQSLLKVIQRYDARILVHDFDCQNLLLITILTIVGVAVRFCGDFQTVSPPLAKFDPIIPTGSEVYSYYQIPDPRITREPLALEISQDPLLSHFTFADVIKVLPFSDAACPPSGICQELTQTTIKFKLDQSTDTSHI